MRLGTETTPGGLSVTTTRLGDETVLVELAGDVDLSTVDQVGARLSSALCPPVPRFVLLDCGEVGFLSCAGLRALIEGDRMADDVDAELCVCGLGRDPLRAVRMAGVADVLSVYESLEEALFAVRV
ncbi:STAS domain-containing protein [Amycolatopsis minnesotensis]|uniref:STAS domain-containing protein n=1 Tax=Amycolatopsis minnesotensis TaxID=337894 RepID=A0ABN2QY93_9PSEU